MTDEQQYDDDGLGHNGIIITGYEEHEDGSATMRLDCSFYVKNALIEAGIITLIRKYINELEHTEHLKNE